MVLLFGEANSLGLVWLCAFLLVCLCGASSFIEDGQNIKAFERDSISSFSVLREGRVVKIEPLLPKGDLCMFPAHFEFAIFRGQFAII